MFWEVLLFIFLIWMFLHSGSYGKWEWKKGNKFGALMIFTITAIAFLLPLIMIIDQHF